MADYDEIQYRVLQASHFGVLSMALAWDRAGRSLVASDARAAKIALGEAVDAYQAYGKLYDEHLPASRHDHDYAAESAAAESLRRSLVVSSATRSTRPVWAAHVLERAFEQALVALPAHLSGEDERALAGVLATACGLAGRSPDAERIARLAKGETGE